MRRLSFSRLAFLHVCSRLLLVNARSDSRTHSPGFQSSRALLGPWRIAAPRPEARFRRPSLASMEASRAVRGRSAFAYQREDTAWVGNLALELLPRPGSTPMLLRASRARSGQPQWPLLQTSV